MAEESKKDELVADGWREGPRDGLWRNDRFGGAYKLENAALRIGSKRGEVTRSSPSPEDPVERAARVLAECTEPGRDETRWHIVNDDQARRLARDLEIAGLFSSPDKPEGQITPHEAEAILRSLNPYWNGRLDRIDLREKLRNIASGGWSR